MPSYERLFRKALDEQLKSIIKDLEENGLDYTLTPTNYRKPILEAFKKTYNEVGYRFYQDTRKAAKSVKGVYITKQDDSIWLEYVLGWVELEGAARITNITETTLNIVKANIVKAVKEGLSIPNTVKLITEGVSDFSKWRAKMIARTEVISASNLGNYQGALSTNLPMTKEWLATNDSRTRDNHAMVSGTKIGKDDLFYVGPDAMKHPHDISASAGNVVNCRCVLTWEVL